MRYQLPCALLLAAHRMVQDDNLHLGMILWSFALSLWTAVFVKYWSRRANALRYDWNVSDNQVLGYRSATRPEFVASNACCQSASDRSGFYTDKRWVPLDKYEEILPIRYKEKPDRWAAKFQPSVDGASVYLRKHCSSKLIVQVLKRVFTAKFASGADGVAP